MLIGTIIKEARQRKKINQKELSKILGVTREMIWHWENNKSTPGGKMLLKIATILDIDLLKKTEKK